VIQKDSVCKFKPTLSYAIQEQNGVSVEWHVIKVDFVDFKRRKADPGTVRKRDQATHSDRLSANHLCHRKTPIASHRATGPGAGNQAVSLRIFTALRPIRAWQLS
jgi:hypothetical protein